MEHHVVIRVCCWCDSRAQRLEMALWTPMPPALIRMLRVAGFTTDGLCPDCWRDGAATFGVRMPREAAVEQAIRKLPDLHRDPFAGLLDVEGDGDDEAAA